MTGYSNLMYTLHFYATTHTDSLRNTLVTAVEDGLPVFVSEYGICDASGGGAINEDQADQWMDLLDHYGISCAAWNLSNKNETCAILRSDCGKTSGFTGDDLTNSGKWLYRMLTGNSDSGSSSAAVDDGGMNPIPISSNGSSVVDRDSFTSANGTIEYMASIVNQWEADGVSFYQYNLKLKNISGRELFGWNVTRSFNSDISLLGGWNGDYEVNGAELSIHSKDYNSTVAADSTVSDIGFIIRGVSTLSLEQGSR